VHASVFGSFARRDGGPDSDIDLLLVLTDGVDPHGPVREDQESALKRDVLAWTGNRAGVLVFTTAKLARAAAEAEPVVDTWAADAVTLLGPEPAALLGSVRSGRTLAWRAPARQAGPMAQPPVDEQPEVHPFATLPEPIRLQDTVASQPTDPPPDPDGGRDPDTSWMIRHA
jgi:hypothetical protein